MKIGKYRIISLVLLLILGIILFSCLGTKQHTEHKELSYQPNQAVILLQTALNEHGGSLAVDGLMGPETYRAAIEWQNSEGAK